MDRLDYMLQYDTQRGSMFVHMSKENTCSDLDFSWSELDLDSLVDENMSVCPIDDDYTKFISIKRVERVPDAMDFFLETPVPVPMYNEIYEDETFYSPSCFDDLILDDDQEEDAIQSLINSVNRISYNYDLVSNPIQEVYKSDCETEDTETERYSSFELEFDDSDESFGIFGAFYH